MLSTPFEFQIVFTPKPMHRTESTTLVLSLQKFPRTAVIPFDPGTGGITAFTASAFGLGRALGVGGTAMGGLVGAANAVGYGLAIAGAATAGLVIGSAINCR